MNRCLIRGFQYPYRFLFFRSKIEFGNFSISEATKNTIFCRIPGDRPNRMSPMMNRNCFCTLEIDNTKSLIAKDKYVKSGFWLVPSLEQTFWLNRTKILTLIQWVEIHFRISYLGFRLYGHRYIFPFSLILDQCNKFQTWEHHKLQSYLMEYMHWLLL